MLEIHSANEYYTGVISLAHGWFQDEKFFSFEYRQDVDEEGKSKLTLYTDPDKKIPFARHIHERSIFVMVNQMVEETISKSEDSMFRKRPSPEDTCPVVFYKNKWKGDFSECPHQGREIRMFFRR